MRIGFLLFNAMTQLDFTGPFEFLASIPDAETYLIARTLEPITSDHGLRLLPTTTYAGVPQLDIFMIPGGRGTSLLLNDLETLALVRSVAKTTPYMTSVCTGSLVLAAAGLLHGRRATTHWNAHEFLAELGAVPVKERTVIDLPFVTGGGVTAGIDFALTLIDEICGRPVAEGIALQLEYDPRPPVATGSPEGARDALVAAVRADAMPMYVERKAAVAVAKERLWGSAEAKPNTL